MSDYLVVTSQKTGKNHIIRRGFLRNVTRGVKLSNEETYEATICEDSSLTPPSNDGEKNTCEQVKILRTFRKNYN